MDAKITKQRLKRLFSYEWIKMIAVVVALIFGWVMIFELTETRIKPSQRFTIFNHMQNKAIVPLTEKKIQGALDENAFSSEVIEITYQDLATAGMYNHQTLESYLGVSDGDIMLLYESVETESLGAVIIIPVRLRLLFLRVQVSYFLEVLYIIYLLFVWVFNDIA